MMWSGESDFVGGVNRGGMEVVKWSRKFSTLKPVDSI